MRLKRRSGESHKWGQYEAREVTYKRFRRRIIQRSCREAPAASTPLAPGRQCEPSFEFDPVCQRLELESPPRKQEPAQGVLQGNIQESALVGGLSHSEPANLLNTACTVAARRQPAAENGPEQRWVWTPAGQEQGHLSHCGNDERRRGLQPFAILSKASLSLQGKSVVKLGAPSLLNDYYTNLLDCSCNGMVALALGSTVYIWNSETRALVGHLDPSPQPGCQYRQSISSLCWSRDGRALSIATRRGEIQLWDVEHKQRMRFLLSHLTVVRALSWKQQLLSSGSVLGHICHLDPRAFTPLVGATTQSEGVCSLQWSPGGSWLASGSTEGHLHIWDHSITGNKMSSQPIMTMKQCSAVKAMGWCPWQRNTIATGGGWKDGELRIWDTQSGSCVTSTHTNSQICSLQWAEKKRHVVTGHGLPHHKVISWMWEFPSLSPIYQFTGHSDRVLHLALNPDNTRIFSTAADQRFHIWDL
ncbi:cell division cycle protein 20 homolog B-like isoform X2 [Archocentrus centrarchus]|uniref:cell division cycle protein 20 homolog B-like isoform X2 n=1 Tax=Archocentrus centrarchus TaxID=63155 RepID=UPI0011EA0BC7|nr:cell division cycle protein 20 homolog B-like isoform X2 [Archocentrus centrarchus]